MKTNRNKRTEAVTSLPIIRQPIRRSWNSLTYLWLVVLVWGFESEMSFADQELQEIVVTAQKREERLQDVPISLSVLSGQALDTSTLQSVNEELNRVPGVVIQPAGGLGVTQIAIRGVAASGLQWSGASPVAYYLDTVPFGFVRSAYIPDANAFDLTRVEVLRGPQGTLYGASAEDGVVRVITNDADPSGFDLKARVLGSATDGGGANGGGDLALNVPIIDGKLAVRAVIDYQDWSGWIDRPNDKDANDAKLRNYRLKLAYNPTDALSIDLSLWSSRDHFGANNQSFPNRTAPYGSTPEPIENDFDAYGAKIAYQGAQFAITSMTSYLNFSGFNGFDLSYLYGFFNNLNVASWLDSHVFSEELLLNSTDTGPWRWTAGAFYRDAGDINAQGAAFGEVVAAPGPSEIGFVDFKDASRSYAVFAQVGQRFLNDKVEWALGLRQFHDDVSTLSLDPTTPSYEAESFNATTPRAVLSWYPNANVTVYSSFSEGFRSGMPQYYATTVIYPAAPPAQAEKLYNYEVGVKADILNHRVSIDTSAYYVKWKDVQQTISVSVPSCGNGACTFNALLNGPSASGAGVDFAVTTRPFSRLEFGATFSWNDLAMDQPLVSGGAVVIPKGDRLTDSSRLTASAFANYNVSLGSATRGVLAVSANYMSGQARYTLAPDGAPEALYGDNLTFVNAAFTVVFPKKWSLKVYGDNLTNEYGALTGPLTGFDPTREGQGTPRPRPRTVGLEADYRYK